jgi:prepilin-type N-terminal cleavage/methylation domain-containing protein
MLWAGDAMRTSRRNQFVRRSGVTLVEVLAALVLVAIVLPVVMQGLTLSMRAASRARHQAEAARLAEAKLNELLVLRDTSILTGAGDFGEHWPGYAWRSESATRDHGLYEVTVTVAWTERGQERTASLSTLVFPGSTSEGGLP